MANGRRYDSGGIERSELPVRIVLSKVFPERPEPIMKKGVQLRFEGPLMTG